MVCMIVFLHLYLLCCAHCTLRIALTIRPRANISLATCMCMFILLYTHGHAGSQYNQNFLFSSNCQCFILVCDRQDSVVVLYMSVCEMSEKEKGKQRRKHQKQ